MGCKTEGHVAPSYLIQVSLLVHDAVARAWYINKFSLARLPKFCVFQYNINGLVQERRNSGALAMELRLSCINSLMYDLEENSSKIHLPDWQFYLS